MSPSADAVVDEHYGRPRLGAAILGALRLAGKNPDALTLDDLAPVDHFHTRGKESTVELVRRAQIERGATVVDVGGGIGGAARLLAHDMDCRVAVVDLTEEFCRVGEDLTRRVGLADRVAFHHGSALAMPFPDGAFDVAWTQHSSMNVADKRALYAEIRRVLRPGGRLAMHEIMAGPTQPARFPVPWARDPAISHLLPPDAIHQLLLALGYRELTWVDQSQMSLDWFRGRAAATAANGPPIVGLHLLLGPDTDQLLSSYLRNLDEQRVRVIMGVWERT